MMTASLAFSPIIFFEEVDSTNSEAERRIRAGRNICATWLVAKTQTGGRGRQGRIWHSPPGNLYASLVLPVAEFATRPISELSFVMGLAVRDMGLALGVAAAELLLKWPNDMLLNGAKCAGILIEQARGENQDYAIVGIGINLATAPSGLDYPVALLQTQAAPEDALQKLQAAVQVRLNQWLGPAGFSVIRQDWLSAATGQNKPIEIRRESGTLRGTFINLDSDGALLVRLPSGTVTAVHAGEIFFPSNKALAQFP